MSQPVSRPLNRPTPGLPAHMMQTHAILAPIETHWRKASCEEVQCEAFLKGWGVPAKDLDEQDLALLKSCGRSYSEIEIKDGEWHYWFPPGQPCFRASTHRIRLDRPELFVRRDGDWRGNPRKTEPQLFSSADAWADSLRTNLDAIEKRR